MTLASAVDDLIRAARDLEGIVQREDVGREAEYEVDVLVKGLDDLQGSIKKLEQERDELAKEVRRLS